MSEAHATRIFAGAAEFTTRGGTRHRGGLFRKTLDSTYADAPWQSLSAGLPENVEARVIAFHPRERDVVYAGTQDGVYRLTATDAQGKFTFVEFSARGFVG